MTEMEEGMIAILICLTILNLSAIGTAIYYFHSVRKKVRKEREIDQIKLTVLIDSMSEIFESKYTDDGKDEKGSIPRRG